MTIRFFLIGILASFVHVVIFQIFDSLAFFSIFYNNIVSFCFAFCISYLGHYYFTYRATSRHRVAVCRFLISAIAGVCVNQFILFVMVFFLGVPPLLGVLAGILVAAVVVYFLSKNWAFFSVQ